MRKIIVEKNEQNKSLITCIKERYKEITTPYIYKLLRKKDIKINGKRISKDQKLAMRRYSRNIHK